LHPVHRSKFGEYFNIDVYLRKMKTGNSPLKQKVMCNVKQAKQGIYVVVFCRNAKLEFYILYAEGFGRFFLLSAGQERMSPHRLYTSTPIPHPSTGTRRLTGPESIEWFIGDQAFLRW
jgi:hypothetical protein